MADTRSESPARNLATSRRAVVHFAGFEPVDAVAHHERFRRAAADSGMAWGCRFDVGPLTRQSDGIAHFTVTGRGPDWLTESRVTLLDHNRLMTSMKSHPRWRRTLSGYRAGVGVLLAGGWRYPLVAWRFCFFVAYPFVLFALAAALSGALALLPVSMLAPVHALWSVPAALVAWLVVARPLLDRLYVPHLFDHWRTGWSLAALDDAVLTDTIERQANALRDAVIETARLPMTISTHSMGASFALHAIGLMLERDPTILEGRKVTLATLGSTLLQSAMLQPAGVLRARIERVLRHPSIEWIDVQSLTDIVNFHGSDVVAATGLASDLRPPRRMDVRAKGSLAPEHYRRIRYDLLRVHRQFVMGSDRRERYDFMMFLFGPLPPSAWVDWAPPFGADCSLPQ